MAIELIKTTDSSFSLVGKLEYSQIKTLDALARKIINFSDKLIINCQELNYCDSAGLALLVNWLKSAKLSKGSLSFVNLTEQIMNMIKLMKLEPVFLGQENAN